MATQVQRQVSTDGGWTASIQRHARFSLALPRGPLGASELFTATALAAREKAVERLLDTEERYLRADAKRLYYLSMEFLAGRSLENNLQNLGALEAAREALAGVGGDLETVLRFDWVRRSLVDGGDPYFHLADFPAYRAAQARAGREYGHPAGWWRKAILNVARTGKFSSDRTIREYANEIWNLRSASE